MTETRAMNAPISWGGIVKRAQAMAKTDGFLLERLGLIAQSGYLTAAEQKEREFSQRLFDLAWRDG